MKWIVLQKVEKGTKSFTFLNYDKIPNYHKVTYIYGIKEIGN